MWVKHPSGKVAIYFPEPQAVGKADTAKKPKQETDPALAKTKKPATKPARKQSK